MCPPSSIYASLCPKKRSIHPLMSFPNPYMVKVFFYEPVVEAIKGLLEVNEQDQGILHFLLDMLHEVEQVQDNTTDVVLRDIGFLLPSNYPFDSWLYPLGYAAWS